MNKLTLLTLSLIPTFLSFNATAEMYKWVDENGNITYSDTPPVKEAEALRPPVLNTVPTVKPKPKASAPEERPEKPTIYTRLDITSPSNNATVRDNSGNISISMKTVPALNTKQGHTISVSLDGKMIKDKIQSTTTSLDNIDRGSHTISASIKNKKGSTLYTSQTITVHLHRAIKKPAPKPAPKAKPATKS